MNIWKSRIFCLVTGGSRGLGRSIAINFCRDVKKDSVFLLLARNQNGLEDTKLQMLEINSSIHVLIQVVDLSEPNTDYYRSLLTNCLQQFNNCSSDFDYSFLVHNAGSLGDLSKDGRSFLQVDELRKYFDLNLNSVIVLTSIYLDMFTENPFVINISSLAALKPFKGWHLYCTGKSARDSYFKVLAQDENCLVLSYAPGPLDTNMAKEIIKTAGKEHREWFLKAQTEGNLLQCDTTVNKLMTIIESRHFKSGEHIDFYDI